MKYKKHSGITVNLITVVDCTVYTFFLFGQYLQCDSSSIKLHRGVKGREHCEAFLKDFLPTLLCVRMSDIHKASCFYEALCTLPLKFVPFKVSPYEF